MSADLLESDPFSEMMQTTGLPWNEMRVIGILFKGGIPNQLETKVHGIPVYNISLRGADEYSEEENAIITAQDLLRRRLEELDLYGTQFGYSAFLPNLLEYTCKNGTYRKNANSKERNIVFCCIERPSGSDPEKMLIIDVYDKRKDLFTYLDLAESEKGTDATFAVYDLSGFNEFGGEYQFKNPNDKKRSLKAVVRIKDYFDWCIPGLAKSSFA